ncbi:response regulator [Polynucleobacter sp. AP-Reno-20A-A9]|uniref:hybrid sensor histidine kinase/response regulator n=1 Tax=Polynucleobacter sp. AP-Reno-20A-A9 TaxID=2576925 RepID=UPI001C0CF5BE|nr:response regulator [Polynucleobacter sp. AP-Reno-20A-A9]MBU3629094.1 response regulator [Polynucleobacter sp. AP-Reno-20A-A9]
MPKIEDLELCNLFRIESAEHLQKLDAGLLQLEKTPGDQSLVQEIFREAHSLKGSARMLGLIDIQGLANTVEDMLGEVRSGKLNVTVDVIKPQLVTLDRIRQLVAEAVGDSPATTEMAQAVPPNKAVEVPSSSFNPVPPAPSFIQTSDVSQVDSINKGRQIPAEFHIDTLRVDAKKLDFLLSQTGELVVSRSRIVRWQDEFNRFIGRLDSREISADEWVKEAQLMRAKLDEDASRLSVIAEAIEGGIRGLRLLPISTLLEQFPRMVHDLAAEEKKEVELVFEGESTVADKRIIEEMKSPLMHMLRNAIDHGIEVPEERLRAGKPEVGKILVKVSQDADHVRLDVIDDGRGLDLEAIRQQAVKRHLYTEDQALGLDDAQLKSVLMTPGFSTNKMITDISGRGVGLDVVRSTVERMRGTLEIDSRPGLGMTFTLNLPVSLTSTRVMILREWGESYALPCDAIYFSKILQPGELLIREDRQCFYHDDEVITVNRLGSLLDKPLHLVDAQAAVICVVVRVGEFSFGLIVDELRDEEEIVLKAPPAPIKRLRNVSGLTILDSGMVCAVLNAGDLAKSVRHTHQKSAGAGDAVPAIEPSTKKSLLLVEDSIVTRIQEKRILEAAGYEVVTAVDGVNAWNILASRSFDAIVSDIMMPNMDGLELAAKIRANRKFSDIPIILVTSLASEDDRRRGLEAGADAYISKSDFDQTVLLDSIARLI